MKCPECSRNHPKRSGMLCTCGYHFVLNPAVDGWTDGRFLAVIKQASGNGTYFFTKNQLYTAFCRRRAKRFGCATVVCMVALGIASSTAAVLAVPAIVALGFVFGAALMKLPWRAEFEGLLKRWAAAKRSIEKLITEPALGSPPPQFEEPDIFDHGVQRMLVVDSDLLVDLLVLNGFHAQQGVLVISLKGYPDYLMPIASKLLDESPELPIFLLHDATSQGTTMTRRVPSLIEGHPVIDLGLFPDDVKALPLLKSTKPRLVDFELPVDLIPFPVLAAMIARAFATNTAFSEVIAAGAADSSGSDGYHGGDFG